ncbi:xanthine dehydrogenase small subunit [candidate division WOR-3 bacterium]|nr:xanthine dehydrogenase small subunit [candidate division WOR-3 bacterium]
MFELSFVLNRDPVRVSVPPLTPTLELLRERLGLTDAREGCGEGDCGACTVALGTRHEGGIRYRPVNSCLLPALKLNGRHLVTARGLADGGVLHPVQQALVAGHAVQCGFCTPGIAVSLFCLFARTPAPADEDVLAALEGNLCRCTGYDAVLAAGRALRDSAAPVLLGWLESVRARLPEPGPAPGLDEVLAAVGRDGSRPLAGGTDLMLSDPLPTSVVDLERVDGLDRVRPTPDSVVIGAAATLDAVARDPVVRERVPVLAEAIGRMASCQIRSVATLAGNVANASPVADGAVVLLALDATLVLASAAGERRLPLREFYLAYRRTAARPDEIVAAVEVPDPPPLAGFEKTGKRGAVDIASANACLVADVDRGTIAGVRCALGGVAPVPLLSAAVPAVLQGGRPSAALFERAADAAAAEVRPISDARGSAGFRRALVRGQVLGLLHRLFEHD